MSEDSTGPMDLPPKEKPEIVVGVGIKGNDDKAELVIPQARNTKPFPRADADREAEREILAEKIQESLGQDADFAGAVAAFQEKMGQGADGGGKRMNAGKNRIELLPEIWIWALADVMTKGSMKYDDRNWEKGMDWSSMIGCMQRHVLKFQSGQRYDGPRFDKKEGTTGCHELAMVAWNALALMFYDLNGIGNNDLPSQQLDLFIRVNAETSDLAERIKETK